MMTVFGISIPAETAIFINFFSIALIYYCLASNANMVSNGGAEVGPCASGSSVVSPTGWFYNGTVTQARYNNTDNTLNNRINTIPSSA